MPTKRTKSIRKNRKPGKVACKLRRWQTRKLGGRYMRSMLLTENPNLVIKGRTVK